MMHSGHPLITNEYELLYDWFICILTIKRLEQEQLKQPI